MKFTAKRLAVLSIIAPFLVAASPVPDPEPHGFPDKNNIECALVNAVVKALTAYSSASPFCSVRKLSLPVLIDPSKELSNTVHTVLSQHPNRDQNHNSDHLSTKDEY